METQLLKVQGNLDQFQKCKKQNDKLTKKKVIGKQEFKIQKQFPDKHIREKLSLKIKELTAHQRKGK